MDTRPERTLWERNDVQFPRLLAEIRAIGLTPTQYRDLQDSTDLTISEIDALLERAEAAWQLSKRLNIR